MTPRTRKSNKEASYEVYYSKKIPHQVRFPHRRKRVRRPQPTVQDGAPKRQMKFLPERMKQGNIKREDSEEAETDVESTMHTKVSVEIVEGTPTNGSKARKRKSDIAQEEQSSDEVPVAASTKRRRRAKAINKETNRTIRRQSTMTQLADGRRPSFGDDEPDFIFAKRRSRVSLGGSDIAKEKDKKQRTLTQMIPGMGRLSKEELEELGDLDADLEDDGRAENDISQTLIEQGLLEIDGPAPAVNAEEEFAESPQEEKLCLPVTMPLHSSSIIQSVEAAIETEDGDEFHPTQFIEAPTLRSRQTPRRLLAAQRHADERGSGKSAKSRFSLLSTPEKRKIFEIPSSQSPAESTLSTQMSPQKFDKIVLQERNLNLAVIQETPSKCRHVQFREPAIQPAPPARLRKFESTIQDSEDEESDLERNATQQYPTYHSEQAISDQAIGRDTQAVLDQIDLACADEHTYSEADKSNLAEEIAEPSIRPRPYQPSPELGESWAPVIYDDDGPDFDSYRSSRVESQRYQNADVSNESAPTKNQAYAVSQLDLTKETQAHVSADDIPSTPPVAQPYGDDDLPSTPMVIKDNSSDEESDLELIPKFSMQRAVRELPSTLVHQSTDLDGEPVQVPRSPSVEGETQHSHSSRAEQQLQSEWLSYSQYVHVRAPVTSSMRAAVDISSYNSDVPLTKAKAPVSSSARIQHSQATTVDEVTPKKNRTQQVTSTNTTPHRSSKSQPLISPEKPPSLFIPSSFPSPSRTVMEGWSSPVMPRTQNVYGSSQMLGSLEDFSIPPPPPIEDD